MSHPDLKLRRIAAGLAWRILSLHDRAEEFSATYFKALDDPDAKVRIGAIAGLGQLHLPEYRARLERLFDDCDPLVRGETVGAFNEGYNYHPAICPCCWPRCRTKTPPRNSPYLKPAGTFRFRTKRKATRSRMSFCRG